MGVSAKRCLFLLMALLAALGAAVPDGGAERNRQVLERWRQDPDHYARLQRDLRAFYALPPDRQERIRRLDRRLHELPPDKQRRLWGVLERYAAWLERLPEEDQRRLAAAAPEDRLKMIRKLREEQFVDRLPSRVRAEVLRLAEDKRASRVAQLRREEAQQRSGWMGQARLGPPARPPSRLSEMPAEVRQFVTRSLMSRLAPEEQEQLKNADTRGEGLARLLVELTERRLSLPPGPGGAILFYKDLPEAARNRAPPMIILEKTGKWPALAKKEGQWPDFALAFLEVVPEGQRHLLPPLGAARPRDFSPEVQKVIKDLGQLSEADADRLQKLEGRWPEYPRLLGDLARQHNLNLPGMTLPGPRDLWEHRN